MIEEILIRYHQEFTVKDRIVPESISPNYIRIKKRNIAGKVFYKGLLTLGKNQQHPIREDAYLAQKEQGIWKSFMELPDELKEQFIDHLNYVETRNQIINEICEFVNN